MVGVVNRQRPLENIIRGYASVSLGRPRSRSEEQRHERKTRGGEGVGLHTFQRYAKRAASSSRRRRFVTTLESRENIRANKRAGNYRALVDGCFCRALNTPVVEGVTGGMGQRGGGIRGEGIKGSQRSTIDERVGRQTPSCRDLLHPQSVCHRHRAATHPLNLRPFHLTAFHHHPRPPTHPTLPS